LYTAHKRVELPPIRLSLIVALLISSLIFPFCANPVHAEGATSSENSEEDTPFMLLEHAKPEVKHTFKPPNLGMEKYVVVEGDTVSGIAKKFDLNQETIIWANAALQANSSILSIGQELWIPPLDGTVHTIASNDTLIDIARKYGVSVEDITECFYNPILEPRRLRPGTKILVPGASRAVHQPQRVSFSGSRPDNAPVGTGELAWPVKGYLTQDFHPGHYAIDIGAWKGKPIAAADDGFVIRAGWNNSGYGFMVIIDHGNGMKTLYAHLDDFRIEAGEAVTKGQVIGTMGNSGNTTGSHLHFEVIVDGVRQNPFDYLP